MHITNAETAARRTNVAHLLTWNYTAGKISCALNIPHNMVSDDLERIRTPLQLNALPSLHQRLLQSIVVCQQLQRPAWELYHSAADDSANKVGGLNALIAAQVRIVLSQGTTALEKGNAADIAEAEELLLQTLDEVGGSNSNGRFLKRCAWV